MRKYAGLTVKNAQIKAIAENIRNLCQELAPAHVGKEGVGMSTRKQQSSEKTNVEDDLRSLCSQCCDVADLLLSALRKLEHEGLGHSWRSFRVAILSVLSERTVDELLARLEQYRRAIDTTLLVLLM